MESAAEKMILAYAGSVNTWSISAHISRNTN
jgi:hypothetical protein